MINCIIIEDDKLALQSLYNLIRNNFGKRIAIVGTAGTVKEGIELIRLKSPDLLFLDIELPDDNGFSVFNEFPQPPFDVIFTTSSPDYAISAIKHMAIDYLLKPVNLIDLNAALVRYEKIKKGVFSSNGSFKRLMENFKMGGSFDSKIALPTMDGFQVIPINEILYCQASESYSYIHTIEGESILVTKTLKSIEETLQSSYFFRIHKSILLNINFVKRFSKKEGFVVTLENDLKFEVATRRQEEFTNIFLRKHNEIKLENPKLTFKTEPIN